MLNAHYSKRVCYLGVTLSLVCNATAAVRYVNLNNPTPAAPYADWSTAATNIQDAVDTALAGDMVLVTNGVYQTGGRVVAGGLTNRVVINKAIIVSSVNGPNVTAIGGYQVPGSTNGFHFVGDAAVRCVYLGSGATLAGFTLMNGATRYSNSDPTNAASGAGVWCQSSSAVVSNCVMTNNLAYGSGGGIYQGSGSNCVLNGNSTSGDGGGAIFARLEGCILSNNFCFGNGGGANQSDLRNCTLAGNVALQGGGSYDGTATNCIYVGNQANVAGGGAYIGLLTRCTLTGNQVLTSGGTGGGAYAADITGSLLTSNRADSGGGTFLGTLNNCTLTGNVATNAGGGASLATLQNCIVYFNAGTNANYDSACELDYCCTTPLPSTGTGNITADPQLAGAAHITAGSPCRGAGSSEFVEGVDIDGESWLNPPAMGCDEYHAGAIIGPLNVAISLSYTNVVQGFAVDLAAAIQGETTGSSWNFGDGTIVSNQPYPAHAWVSVGDYAVILTAFNQTYPGGIAATAMVHVISRPVHYVNVNSSSPAAPYTSLATAATTIQDAVDAASVPGALVLVADGRYRAGFGITGITNRVSVTKLLTVQSVNGPSHTGIDGGNVMSCVYLTNGATLSGFTVFGGAAGTVYGGVWSDTGLATVSNCVVTANSYGAYNVSLVNCTMAGNPAGASSCVLSNCLVANNQPQGGINACTAYNSLISSNASYFGGGASGSTLNNCTLVGNVGYTQGGGAYNSKLYNCISYYNWSPAGSNYNTSFNTNFTCTFTNCCTWPLPTNGTGNFSNEPGFIDYAGGNLRLQSNAPCINAGNNGFAVGSVDLDGRPRIVGGTVDVGAYEFQQPGFGEFLGWLQRYGLPADGSADFADSDGDGVNNWQEFLLGTSPTNATSQIKAFPPAITAGGVTVSWSSVAGRSYFVQRANTLGTGAFSVVATNISGQAGTTSWTDTNALTGLRWYRVGAQYP